MTKPAPRQRLADIHGNIAIATRYVEGITLEEFSANGEKQDAVVRRLQNASEALTRLKGEYPERYAELEAAHPSLPWQSMRRLGDRYRHAYDIIDLALVWQDLHGYVRHISDAIQREIAFLNESSLEN